MARAQRRMRRPVTNFFLITNLCVFVLDWLMKGAALEAGAKINYMITVNGQQPRTKFMHDLIFSSLRTIASSHPCSFTWGSFTSSSTPCRSTLLDLRYVPDHFLPHARVHVTSRIAIGHVTLGAWCCASFEREGTRREGAMRRGVV
eukprot:2777145-Rhodomonas_salina.3